MEEDYEEETDQIEDNAETQVEAQQEYLEDVSPTPPEKNDKYALFKWSISKKDSSKVANLDKQELGKLPYSVRDCQYIHLLSKALGAEGFAEFFKSIGEITLATSCSKSGWYPELFISEKRYSSKTRKKSFMTANQQNKKYIS
jgi:hypothetical protein